MRKYGWKRDLPDFRDKRYSRVHARTELPRAVDLRSHCSPVEDQGDLGSCTANALTSAMEFLREKHRLPLTNFSRLFLYYNERLIERTVDEDAGAEIRTGIKSLVRFGVCHETTWPYDVFRLTAKPGRDAYEEGRQHQILEYRRIRGLHEMKSCLADGYPFTFGFSVFNSFETDEVARTGVCPMPKATDSLVGGHAVLAVGYDDSAKMMIVRNSWGVAWGKKGYFLMPYKLIDDEELADDMWVIYRGEDL